MKLTLIGFALYIGINLNAQSHFEIMSIGTDYSEEQIELAFNDANFCGYYKQSQRVQIVLNDGAIVELLSSEEFDDDEMDASCINSNDFVLRESVWGISSSGIVTRKTNATFIKKEK